MPAQMTLTPGTRLGQYEVVAPIGAGGMGEVYRARDRKLARDVAIKTLPATLASEPGRLARLRQEALILASLNHPNIGVIYGLEESGGANYLVLEFIDGETLAERLSRTGPMSTAQVLRTANQIADALEAAHAKGIAHRDIKPSNIKVTPEGRVKVLDFGIAKSISHSEIQDQISTRSTITAAFTEPGRVVGTPPYMSPEQIRGQVSDRRTDVWAFGCLVYELLCGKPPFRGPTVPDIFATILQNEPDWRALPRSVPTDVREWLRRCREKDATRRLQNFAEVRRGLARAMSGFAAHEYARQRLLVALGALPIALTTFLTLVRPNLFGSVEYSVYDTVLSASTRVPPDPRIVIVDIDERSLATIGQWPWRRDVLGRLVEGLSDLGARTIALNMLLAEPDASRGFAPVDDGSLQQKTPDEFLEDSLRTGKVVLGYGFTFGTGGMSVDQCELHPLEMNEPLSIAGADSGQSPLYEASGAVCSLQSLAVAAGRSGFLNAAPDSDGVLRRAPLVIQFDGRVYPSLALTAVTATSTHGASLRLAPPSEVVLTLGQRVVPLDRNGNLLLRFRGQKRTFPYISAADVMDGRATPATVHERFAFVGTTALGTRNVVATPLDTLFPDLEVQATAADNLLQEDFIQRPISGTMFESLAVLGLGVTLTLLAARIGLLAGALAAVAGLLAIWVAAVWLLSATGTFLSPLYPTVGTILTFLIVNVGKARIEHRRADTAIRKIESTILDR